MTLWLVILATALGCFALKLAGIAAPRQLLDHPGVQRFAMLVPLALLTALVALQTFAEGQQLVLDLPRLAGLGAAVVALLARAPFLVVIVVAAATAAVLRVAGLG